MFELDQRIAEQLTHVALNSAVQVRVGTANSFMVTASTMVPLMQMFEMGGSMGLVFWSKLRSFDQRHNVSGYVSLNWLTEELSSAKVLPHLPNGWKRKTMIWYNRAWTPPRSWD